MAQEHDLRSSFHREEAPAPAPSHPATFNPADPACLLTISLDRDRYGE